MGGASIRPFGLPVMDCPFCHHSFQVRAEHANEDAVTLTCWCRAKTKKIRKPDSVQRISHNHFVYDFPCQFKHEIEWEREGETKKQQWTSIPRLFRSPLPE